MSAAKRVAHAAKTIRARWEQQVSTDPQTEAAQALEDTGQLLDPEVADELKALREARELAEVIAGSSERERAGLLARYERALAPFCTDPTAAAAVMAVRDHEAVWLLRDAQRRQDRVIELEADLATANGALDDVAKARRADASCPCPPADQPGPHQVGCPLAEVPVVDAAPLFPTVGSLREVSSREEPHDSPLHRPYATPHDLDMPGTGGAL